MQRIYIVTAGRLGQSPTESSWYASRGEALAYLIDRFNLGQVRRTVLGHDSFLQLSPTDYCAITAAKVPTRDWLSYCRSTAA